MSEIIVDIYFQKVTEQKMYSWYRKLVRWSEGSLLV